MRMRWLFPFLVVGLSTSLGCAGRQAPKPQFPPTSPGVYPILSAAGPIPTETLRKGIQRQDIEIRPTSQDLNPSVITDGESVEFVLGTYSRASFAGDDAGEAAWSIDNFLLVEVVEQDGTVSDRFAVGFVTGTVYFGTDLLENVGSWARQFEARSPDLSLRLPKNRPIRLRITALDNGNTGSLTDVFLVIEKTTAPKDDLRDGFWGNDGDLP